MKLKLAEKKIPEASGLTSLNLNFLKCLKNSVKLDFFKKMAYMHYIYHINDNNSTVAD